MEVKFNNPVTIILRKNVNVSKSKFLKHISLFAVTNFQSVFVFEDRGTSNRYKSRVSVIKKDT